MGPEPSGRHTRRAHQCICPGDHAQGRPGAQNGSSFSGAKQQQHLLWKKQAPCGFTRNGATLSPVAQDRDGKLSVEEFVVWFLSEVAALLPFKRNGATTLSCAPLYNRLVYYMLAGRGPGVRRKVSGLQVGQLMQLCADVGIIDQAETVERNALQIAGTYASCDRAVVGVRPILAHAALHSAHYQAVVRRGSSCY